MDKKSLGRRSFLKLLGATALGTAGACAAPSIVNAPVPGSKVPPTDTAAAPSATPTREPAPTVEPATLAASAHPAPRVLRIAHMTDWHMLPVPTAEDGMVRALRSAQQQPDPPDFILNTGDCVMDALAADKGKAEAEWKTFMGTLRADCRLPVVHAIGNHDVWGWGMLDPWIDEDPMYGKGMALEQLGLNNRYYSFDRAGWHFIVLDSIHTKNTLSEFPYIGQLDSEQHDWLVSDLQAVTDGGDAPICIASHIPIMGACEYFEGHYEESGNWVVPASMLHIDARRFRELFRRTPNVKLCLSGHTHQYESVDYLGVRYINSGAVSGDWWRGDFIGFPPGYVMIDLFADGTAESEFVAY